MVVSTDVTMNFSNERDTYQQSFFAGFSTNIHGGNGWPGFTAPGAFKIQTISNIVSFLPVHLRSRKQKFIPLLAQFQRQSGFRSTLVVSMSTRSDLSWWIGGPATCSRILDYVNIDGG